MSTKWVTHNGLAVVKFPHIATGPKQIPLLCGDHLVITHKNCQWFGGYNLLTGIKGIFPSVCVSSMNGNALKPEILFGNRYDLLLREAGMVIKKSLDAIKDPTKSDPKMICSVTNIISELIELIDKFSDKGIKVESYPAIHSKVAICVDKLRLILGLKKVIRTQNSSPTTVSTWGREMFENKNVGRNFNSAPEYVLFHITLTVKGLKNPMEFRVQLFQRNKYPWLSSPYSVILSPEENKIDLMFDQLDTRDIKEALHLVIYSYEHNLSRGSSTDRTCVSCCVIDLPSCKNRMIFSKTDPINRDGYGVTTTSLEYLNKLHYYMINNTLPAVTKSIARAYPNFEIQFRAFSGTIDKVFEKEPSLRVCRIVPPLSLPTTVFPNLKRDTVSVTISQISQNSARKRSRIVIRLLDLVKKIFVRAVENLNTHEHDQVEWYSATFKGKQYNLFETFSIDLSKTDTPISSLCVAIEVQRSNFTDSKLCSSSYTMIPLASVIGSLTNKCNEQLQLHHWSGKDTNPSVTDFVFPPEGRVVGTLDTTIVFASTCHTQNETLYKLIKFNDYTPEIGTIIKSFSEINISEWSKFISVLLMNLCIIISQHDSLQQSAYNALRSIFIQVLLTPSYGEHILILDSFVKKEFKDSNNQLLGHLNKRLLPLFIDSLKIDDTSTDFRNLIKVSPYILQLVAQSYTMNRSRQQYSKHIDSVFTQQIKSLFDILNQKVKEIPDEGNSQRKSAVFANQQLIISNFVPLIEALHLCYDHAETAHIVQNFVASIRYKPDDLKQTPINKSKMRLLLGLTVTDCWKNKIEREILNDMFAQQIVFSAKLEQCGETVVQILASLFFSARDEFVLQFLPMLKESFEANETQSMSRLLLNIAFIFPHVFLPDLLPLLLKLMNSDFLGSNERLFVFSHFLQETIDEIITLLLKTGGNMNVQLITKYLELAVQSGTYIDTDIGLTRLIYPSNADFSSLLRLFESIPLCNISIVHSLILPLMHCHTLYNRSELMKIFNLLPIEQIMIQTLHAIYEISQKTGFGKLSEIFEGPNRDNLKVFARSLMDSRLERNPKNYDVIVESLNNLIRICEGLKDTKLQPIFHNQLCNIHKATQNHLECALSLIRALNFFQCDNKKPSEIDRKYIPFYEEIINSGNEIETNRQIQRELYFKAVTYMQKSGLYSFIPTVFSEMKKKIVQQHYAIEDMTKIVEKEAEVFMLISQKASFPKYYYVSFVGSKFDNHHQGKEYVYRFDSSYNNEKVVAFLNDLYPESTISTSPCSVEARQPDSDKHIYIYSLKPNISIPIQDKQPEYIINQQIHNFPSTFISECFNNSESYAIITTSDPLPSTARRVAVVTEIKKE